MTFRWDDDEIPGMDGAMPEHKRIVLGFWQDIFTRPWDVSVVRIFADWLEEHSNAETAAEAPYMRAHYMPLKPTRPLRWRIPSWVRNTLLARVREGKLPKMDSYPHYYTIPEGVVEALPQNPPRGPYRHNGTKGEDLFHCLFNRVVQSGDIPRPCMFHYHSIFDHKGTMLVRTEPSKVLAMVSEPYELDFEEIDRFAKFLGCDWIYCAYSYHYPGRSWRVVFLPDRKEIDPELTDYRGPHCRGRRHPR